ncbi:hypothetical protein QKW35_21155 [Pontibacterium granulatum]|uniref:Spy/CpxP family protein refolding chaperone n=1 Tax=Pontibacterium granulatum TaxID=2036029 RepID=UPI00249BD377|nr:hypothetical protein [Pontibacterium granulatum]MDI3326892.1 hypothetical protein [Pontibacterium granulatum]
MKNVFLGLILGVASGYVVADSPSPYAGQELRRIKSLSEERISGLLDGKGLGYAKVAELNGFPGPAHVLELANELKLSEKQRQQTTSLFNDMKSKAKDLGAKLLDAEKQLDQLFRNNEISEDIVSKETKVIGILEGQLRAAHVNAHIKQKALLTEHQIRMYNHLRGYSDGGHKGKDHDHH